MDANGVRTVLTLLYLLVLVPTYLATYDETLTAICHQDSNNLNKDLMHPVSAKWFDGNLYDMIGRLTHILLIKSLREQGIVVRSQVIRKKKTADLFMLEGRPSS